MTTAELRSEPRASGFRDVWPVATAAYAGSRLVALVAYLTTAHLRPGTSLMRVLTAWDGGWYVRVIRDGYPSQLVGPDGTAPQSTVGFFPGFPTLARFVDPLLPGREGPALVAVSLVAGLCATVLFATYAARHADAVVGRRAALLFCCLPGAHVLGMAYAEGTMIAFTIACLLLLEDRRWVLAGLAGAAATMTRMSALALVAAAAVAAVVELRQRDDRRAVIAPALTACGLAGFMTFLWVRTGHLRAYERVEHDAWRQKIEPFNSAGRTLWRLITMEAGTGTAITAAGTIFAAVALVLLIRDRPPAPLLAYTVASLVLHTAASGVGMRPRFVLLAFPLLLPLARRLRGLWLIGWVALSTTLMFLAAVHYTAGFFPHPQPASLIP